MVGSWDDGVWRIVLPRRWRCVMGDREELVWLTRASSMCGRGWRSGRGSCCWPRTGCRTPRSPAGRGVTADGDHVAGRYARAGSGRAGRRAASGRPRTVDHRAIVAATLRPPPKKYGVTHWSSRLLAAHLRIGNATVARAWREYGVQPWRAETFKFSTDPELVAKVTDVVGLYLAPPENAIVLCVDEKSQIQALDRTAADAADAARPARAAHPRLRPARHHDLVRGAGDRHRQGHRGVQAAAPAPGVPAPSSSRSPGPTPTSELHLVMDNYAAHKRVEVRDWLAANPRIHVHFTPTSGVVAEPGRGLVRHHRTPSHPPRHLRLRPRPQRQDPRLHRRLERPLPPLRLDQDRRRDPQESQPSTDFRNGPR